MRKINVSKKCLVWAMQNAIEMSFHRNPFYVSWEWGYAYKINPILEFSYLRALKLVSNESLDTCISF